MRHGLIDQGGAIDYCAEEGELLSISREVDPAYEIASITKKFDGGPALLFKEIKGYPKWNVTTNLLSRRDRVARFFGTSREALPKRILDAVQNPIPCKLARHAACQENVITENIDILKTLPVIKHTNRDVGPIISGGVVMINIPKEMGGGERTFNLSFHRLNPGLGKDWVSLRTLHHRHFLEVLNYHKRRKEEYPITIHIGLSPALNVMAGGTLRGVRPDGADDLGIAGGLQGEAVEICKAKTIEGYALARAEVVLEGKVMYEDEIMEAPSFESTKTSKDPERIYFFPEATGYEGIAGNAYKAQITGITHKNSRVYYAPLGDSVECINLGATVSEASIYRACKTVAPNIFVNCHIPDSMRGAWGVVLQCRVTDAMQQGLPQDLINAAFSAVRTLRWVIAVDEDVDIYDPSDVLWAMALRTRADEDIEITKRVEIGDAFSSKWWIDTTVPISDKWKALRPEFEPVDLDRWLTPEEVLKGSALMSKGAGSIAKRRF